MSREGWEGWDQYAPFYDWENAQTLGRRDLPFWRRMTARAKGPVLELGCGTGRLALPLAKAGVHLIGVDRSAPMLDRARRRAQRVRQSGCPQLIRSDIRTLPFLGGRFALVMAPYGVLQSLLHDRDLAATLRSVARVLAPGGLFVIDLVPDLVAWREYDDRVQFRGRAGRRQVTLVESVRQDRRRGLTVFTERYIEHRGRAKREHRFELHFRTLTIPQLQTRLTREGFRTEALFGDYHGASWAPQAETWVLVARREASRGAAGPLRSHTRDTNGIK